MKLRRVRFTEGARAQIAEEKLWWLRNRDQVEVFGEELHEAVALLKISPAAGTGYPRPAIPGVRRVHLRRLSSHLYYTFDDAEVIVRRSGTQSERRARPSIHVKPRWAFRRLGMLSTGTLSLAHGQRRCARQRGAVQRPPRGPEGLFSSAQLNELVASFGEYRQQQWRGRRRSQ